MLVSLKYLITAVVFTAPFAQGLALPQLQSSQQSVLFGAGTGGGSSTPSSPSTGGTSEWVVDYTAHPSGGAGSSVGTEIRMEQANY